MINELNIPILEPNTFSQNQKTYEVSNNINNNNNNYMSLSTNEFNYQIPNINLEEEKEIFRPKTCTDNFRNFQISNNNNCEEMEENEEDTEKEAVEFIQLQHEKIKMLKKELKIKDETIKEYKEKYNKINLKDKDEQENIILCKNLR